MAIEYKNVAYITDLSDLVNTQIFNVESNLTYNIIDVKKGVFLVAKQVNGINKTFELMTLNDIVQLDFKLYIRQPDVNTGTYILEFSGYLIDEYEVYQSRED